MKYLILFLFLLLSTLVKAQELRASITLADGTFIVNAPSGRTWEGYKATGFKVYRVTSNEILIDDSDINRIKYYGDWRISTKNIFGPPDISGGCNCSWGNNPKDSLVFKFTKASRFEWWGERVSHHGKANVYFDRMFQGIVNTYSPSNTAPVLNWSIDDLDTAQVYTFKLVPTGTKNFASSGTYVVNHGFKLYEIDMPPIEPPDPPIDSTDVIIDPPIDSVVVVDTIRIIDFEYSITRSGRFQIFIDGVQDEGEHNEYEKAIEHALRAKALNPDKNVTIKSPIRRIELK